MAHQKYTARYWNSEITRAKDATKPFLDAAKESVNLYSGKHKLDDVARRLSVWWYIVETLLPAYFSRIPKVETSLRAKAGEGIFQIGALVAQRATQYELDECMDFPAFALASAKSFLLTGSTVAWVRYEPVMVADVSEYGVIRGQDGRLYDGEGQPYEGDEALIAETESGLVVREEIQRKDDEHVILEAVNYADYLSCPARNTSEEDWRARRAYMTREKAIAKFGKDVANKLKFDSYPEELKKGRTRDQNLYEGKAEIWEIHCRETGKVYWIQQAGEKSILEAGDPPLKFKDFYPCEVLAANTSPDSTIPTSDYIQLKDQIMEVERLTSRIAAMTQAIRANGVYDATLGEAVEKLLQDDLRLDPLKNWPSYKAKGGLAAALEMLPIDPYVNALQQLVQTREMALQRLYESIKASDLIRGVTDPRETATAQEHKQQWATLGLSVRQEQFARFVSRCVAKVGAVILDHYSDERIAQASNLMDIVRQTQMAGMPLDPAQVLQSLRGDEVRNYKIEIATDSLVALDERADRQERVDLVASFGSFFGQMSQTIEQYPVLAPFALEMSRFVTRTYRAGKELETTFMAAIQAVTQIAQQKQQQQQQQPPDPSTIAAQAQMQVAQLEAQTKTQALQVQAQEAQTKAQLEQTRLSIEAQLKQSELAVAMEKLKVEQMKAQAEIATKGQELAIRERESQRDTAIDALKTQIDAQMAAVANELQAAKIENERQKTMLDGYEKLLEERRLSLERAQASKPELPSISIQVDAKQPTKRRGKVVRNETGGIIGIETEDV